MKILITGCKGQLGNEFQNIIKVGKTEIGQVPENIKGSEIIAFDKNELDITNIIEVRRRVSSLKPDVLINCAASTNVDSCESNENIAFKVNSIGPRNLAIACEDIGAKFDKLDK